MKKVNQVAAIFALMFIGVVVISWLLNAAVTFLGLLFLEPMRGLGILCLGSVLIYGLSKVKDL